jgi:hemerythrin-like domain-containing protein
MSVDHEFIRRYIEQINEAARALESASSQEKAALQVKLERLTLQLQAVLTLHLEKEERVYIPIMEEHMPEDEQERVLVGMHEQYEEPANA